MLVANGEIVERHPDFRFVCIGNTLGFGSTKGFISQKIDAATLDRFIVIQLEYDTELENDLFPNRSWVEYVLKVRNEVEKSMNRSVYITPRASRQGEMLLRSGMSPEKVCDYVLFRFLSKDQKDTVIKNVGLYKTK